MEKENEIQVSGCTIPWDVSQAKSGSAGVTCLASGPRPGLVSGSREGIITSWAVDIGTTLQTIDVSQVQPASKLAPPAKGGPFLLRLCLTAGHIVSRYCCRVDDAPLSVRDCLLL